MCSYMHVRGYVREDGGGGYIMWLEGDSVSVQTLPYHHEGRDTAEELYTRLQLMTTLPAALVLLLVRRQREGLTHQTPEWSG